MNKEKKTIEIRIAKDGVIRSETHGMKGRSCLQYIDILQELLQAEVIDSKFTPEYLMQDAEDKAVQIQETEMVQMDRRWQ